MEPHGASSGSSASCPDATFRVGRRRQFGLAQSGCHATTNITTSSVGCPTPAAARTVLRATGQPNDFTRRIMTAEPIQRPSWLWSSGWMTRTGHSLYAAGGSLSSSVFGEPRAQRRCTDLLVCPIALWDRSMPVVRGFLRRVLHRRGCRHRGDQSTVVFQRHPFRHDDEGGFVRASAGLCLDQEQLRRRRLITVGRDSAAGGVRNSS